MKKRDVYGYLIGIAAAELVGLLARLFSGAGEQIEEEVLAKLEGLEADIWTSVSASNAGGSEVEYGNCPQRL